MSEPTLIMKLTALRDYVMVLGVSESDCDVFDEAESDTSHQSNQRLS